MQAHWKELLPVDPYTVCSGSIIHYVDLKIINYLYQPLIGPFACQLYMTLWQEADDRETIGQDSFTHHHLMIRTNSSLDKLLEERKKLEAIGLLKVYKKMQGDRPTFIYMLEAPLSPARFFSDGLMNIYLYNRVGKREYLRLKSVFTPAVSLDEDMEEITAGFNDVFASLHASELTEGSSVEGMDSQPETLDKREGVPKLRYQFDFEHLFQLLSDVIISREAFTDEIKLAIEKLAFVYRLGAEEMSRIIQGAFLHTGVIDIELLRKEVRNFYQIEHGDQLPSLALRTQAPHDREMDQREPKDDYERQIHLFETISPYELLEAVAGGAKPAPADLKIVEETLFDQKLNPGVMNVLLHYVMTTNDYRLVKGYIQKIAAHWARKNITTVRAAMELAKSEHKKYQEWQTNKKRPTNRSNQRKERLPKWMTGEWKVQEQSDEDVKKRVQELEQFLTNL
ncbi:MAG: replication initiation and membrane attachment family protein [Tuberibacillus sp.]